MFFSAKRHRSEARNSNFFLASLLLLLFLLLFFCLQCFSWPRFQRFRWSNIFFFGKSGYKLCQSVRNFVCSKCRQSFANCKLQRFKAFEAPGGLFFGGGPIFSATEMCVCCPAFRGGGVLLRLDDALIFVDQILLFRKMSRKQTLSLEKRANTCKIQ